MRSTLFWHQSRPVRRSCSETMYIPPSERQPFQVVHASVLNRGPATATSSASDGAKRSAPHSRAPSPGIDRLRTDRLYASVYAPTIMANLRAAEALRPALDYLSDSTPQAPRVITERMRYILVDWLVEVHLKFHLVPETLFLAVEILDRFLNRIPVAKRELQLAACTAMMIAAKYEEVLPPPVDDFHYISARVYPISQILDYELTMLNELRYCLTVPTVRSFTLRLVEMAKSDPHDRIRTLGPFESMCEFTAEAALLCYPALRENLSLVAAAAVYLARLYLAPSSSLEEAWSPTLAYYSGYVRDQIRPVARLLNESYSRMADMKCKGLVRKYEQPELHSVSTAAISAAGLFQSHPENL